jgi:nitrogen fixation NifU-like protein
MQLDELYRQVIMDHYQRPRNKGRLDGDVIEIQLKNPSCCDEVVLQLDVDDGIIRDVRFNGVGCSISMASASMMTEAVKGADIATALKLAGAFRSMMKGEPGDISELGDLEALQGVSKFPARIKCATLPWNALEKAVGKE